MQDLNGSKNFQSMPLHSWFLAI